MVFNSLDLKGRVIDPRLERFLSEAQLSRIHEFKERLAGVLITPSEINQAIDCCAQAMAQDYLDRGIRTVVGVYTLNGARYFFGKLSERLTEYGLEIIEDNICATRYGGTLSGGALKIMLDVREINPGDHVFVVDDVIDEGLTYEGIDHRIQQFQPASTTLVALCFKPDKCKVDLPMRYVPFRVDDHWLVGMGMDLSCPDNHKIPRALYRQLPFVAVANPDYLLRTGQINDKKHAQLQSLIKF